MSSDGIDGKFRFCAVDLGAGSGRVVAGRLSGGRWTLDEVGRFPTPALNDAVCGYQCWDLDAILEQLRAALERAAALGPVASVGVDSWGVDYVLLDDELREVGKAVCYRDHRIDGQMEKFLSRIPAEEVYRRTGIQFLSINTLFQLAGACDQQKGWMDAARHLLMIPDYLHFRLSGVLSNEYTNATTTGALSLDGKWDQTLLAAAGLKRNLMLEPVDAATVLGETQFGCCAKVVAPATHDTASAVAGTPLQNSSEAYISSGTWSLMGIESRVPFAGSDALRMNFTNEGGLERRFRVLKNLMGLWLLQCIAHEHEITDIATLVAQAAQATAWRSLVNPDDDLFLNPPSMTDAIRDYCRSAGEPEPRTLDELARTVFDSLALAYWNVKSQLEELSGRRLERIRIVGGGCQNRLLNQLCADACQVPVLAGPVEASTIGNLSAQAIALGAIRDLDAAREVVRASFDVNEFHPRTAVPEAAFRRFELLLHTRFQKGVARA